MENYIIEEEWKAIPDWDGYYEASTFGRIRSVDRVIVNSVGAKRFWPGIILKQNSNGRYLHVGLGRGGKLYTLLVHVLIATTFHEKSQEDFEVMHLNHNRLDNHYLNLKWGSHLQNMRDSTVYRNTKLLFGWQRPKCKYDKSVYKKVYELHNGGKLNNEQIGRAIGVSSGTVFKWLKTYRKHKSRIDLLMNEIDN